MTNNYILRRLRYTFKLNDQKMIELFSMGGLAVTREQTSAWLKKDDDPDYVRCTDQQMAYFLNGFIIEHRGPKGDEKPKAEYRLNNNIILRKLKIALNLIDQDIIDLLDLAEFSLSKSELTALFRKPDHQHFRECQDQLLRNFLQGLQMKHTSQSTAAAQSKYQVLKAQSENRKEEQKNSQKSGDKAAPKSSANSAKKIYKNPNPKNKRSQHADNNTLKLKKKNDDSSASNSEIWKPLKK